MFLLLAGQGFGELGVGRRATAQVTRAWWKGYFGSKLEGDVCSNASHASRDTLNVAGIFRQPKLWRDVSWWSRTLAEQQRAVYLSARRWLWWRAGAGAGGDGGGGGGGDDMMITSPRRLRARGTPCADGTDYMFKNYC